MIHLISKDKRHVFWGILHKNVFQSRANIWPTDSTVWLRQINEVFHRKTDSHFVEISGDIWLSKYFWSCFWILAWRTWVKLQEERKSNDIIILGITLVSLYFYHFKHNSGLMFLNLLLFKYSFVLKGILTRGSLGFPLFCMCFWVSVLVFSVLF